MREDAFAFEARRVNSKVTRRRVLCGEYAKAMKKRIIKPHTLFLFIVKIGLTVTYLFDSVF